MGKLLKAIEDLHNNYRKEKKLDMHIVRDIKLVYGFLGNKMKAIFNSLVHYDYKYGKNSKSKLIELLNDTIIDLNAINETWNLQPIKRHAEELARLLGSFKNYLPKFKNVDHAADYYKKEVIPRFEILLDDFLEEVKTIKDIDPEEEVNYINKMRENIA